MKYLPSLYSNHQARGDFLLGNSLFIGFPSIDYFIKQGVFPSRDAACSVRITRFPVVLSDAARSVPTVGWVTCCFVGVSDERPKVINSISFAVGTLRAASVSHGFPVVLSDAARSVPTGGWGYLLSADVPDAARSVPTCRV
jgi:hypothetical protein